MGYFMDLGGIWNVDLGEMCGTAPKSGSLDAGGENFETGCENPAKYTITLPGTLDEGGIGSPDTAANQWHPDQNLGKDEDHKTLLQDTSCIMTRFTRKHVYTGEASYSRCFSLDAASLKGEYRYFLKIERTRKCKAYLNGKECPTFTRGTLSSPYVFEITRLLTTENTLTLVVDNSYEGWPASDILYSSAATDETQTNWNGILGDICILREKKALIRDLRVLNLPERKVRASFVVEEETEEKTTEICHSKGMEGGAEESPKERNIHITCVYAPHKYAEKRVTLYDGRETLVPERNKEAGQMEDGKYAGHAVSVLMDLPEDLPEWDSAEGNLYTLTIAVEGCENKQIRSGYRTFGNDGEGHFALNGRRIFLRAEANCCVFPETGHMPLTKEAWQQILSTYTTYGVNTMRFHSHFPPKAAFEAADEMGVLMMPELSDWNPKDALETPERFAYYKMELEEILREYSAHPSFVTLTFGNELHCGEEGIDRLKDLLEIAHKTDPTRLFADGSNNFYGARGFFTDEDPVRSSDFYTASDFKNQMIRGTSANMLGYINHDMQGTDHNFDALLDTMRKESLQPVIPHEVGQFEVLPDFHEIDLFHGVTIPANLLRLQEIAGERGFLEDWEKRVAASGELARISYREEVEAALRTKDMGGISLLGLQDFPGQGTALVGMLNSHLQPKPYDFAKPERFAAFFRDCLPLLITEKLIYQPGEVLRGKIKLADFGKNREEKQLTYRLEKAGEVLEEGKIYGDKLHVMFPETEEAAELSLRLEARCGEILCGSNTYSLWVYPEYKKEEHGVVTCVSVEEGKRLLAEGKRVLCCPPADKEQFPDSIGTHFTTDFWSVGTFEGQDGFMGIMTDASHPVYAHFPTKFHADRQWWNLLYRGRAFRTEEDTPMHIPGAEEETIIDVLDSYAKMRHLSALTEYRMGEGRMLVCSLGLMEKTQHPEVRALLQGLYDYLASDG